MYGPWLLPARVLQQFKRAPEGTIWNAQCTSNLHTKSGGMGCNAFFFRRSCPSEDAPAKKMAGRAYVHPVPQRNSDPPRLENPGSPCQGSVGLLQMLFLRRTIRFHHESSEYCGYSSSNAPNPVRSGSQMLGSHAKPDDEDASGCAVERNRSRVAASFKRFVSNVRSGWAYGLNHLASIHNG